MAITATTRTRTNSLFDTDWSSNRAGIARITTPSPIPVQPTSNPAQSTSTLSILKSVQSVLSSQSSLDVSSTTTSLGHGRHSTVRLGVQTLPINSEAQHSQRLVALKEFVVNGGEDEDTLRAAHNEWQVLEKLAGVEGVEGVIQRIGLVGTERNNSFPALAAPSPYPASLLLVLPLHPLGPVSSFVSTYPSYIGSTLFFDFAHQLLSSLTSIHSKGIIHGDLKPQNVLLGTDFRLQIIDFSSSLLLPPDSESLPVQELGSHLSLGTTIYSAPELVNPDTRSLTTALDIFAMGLVLLYLITGREPYEELTSQSPIGGGSAPSSPVGYHTRNGSGGTTPVGYSALSRSASMKVPSQSPATPLSALLSRTTSLSIDSTRANSLPPSGSSTSPGRPRSSTSSSGHVPTASAHSGTLSPRSSLHRRQGWKRTSGGSKIVELRMNLAKGNVWEWEERRRVNEWEDRPMRAFSFKALRGQQAEEGEYDVAEERLNEEEEEEKAVYAPQWEVEDGIAHPLPPMRIPLPHHLLDPSSSAHSRSSTSTSNSSILSAASATSSLSVESSNTSCTSPTSYNSSDDFYPSPSRAGSSSSELSSSNVPLQYFLSASELPEKSRQSHIVPQDLRKLIREMLSPAPEKRPTAKEALDRLVQISKQ